MKVLITSGGTKVPIDKVRFITNMSSGTFGSRIALEALMTGNDVIFLHAEKSKTPFSGVVDVIDEPEAAGDLVKELSLGDFVAFSYSPTDLLNDIVKDPVQATNDLERIIEFVPEKKIGIFEISWSTSDFVEGNEIDQAEFIEHAFDFYRENESQIEFFTWYRQYDRPEGTCDPEEQQSIESKISVGGDSGFGSSEFVIERLGYYTCNAGLIDVNGMPKQGWNEFTTQIRQ